ncbi:MAG: DUF554 domain-containing protein [Ruminococcaceae bacterium]|nr:DUF554 domain-containing protein [Oscillospiraceae bacterium]
MWGSIVNCLTVILGSTVGLIVKRFMGKSTEGGVLGRIADTLMMGVALCVMLIGITGSIKTQNIIIVILSMVIGGVIGEACNLQGGVEKLGDFLEKKTKGKFGSVTQGFVSASLLFCVGAMAIVGSLNSGLLGDHSMLYTKSLLDMISAFVFASTLGFGVIFSSLLVLVYQGTITLLASLLSPILTEIAIVEMTAVGSLLIVGLSLNMLKITKIKVMNLVPAIFVSLIFCLFL